MAASVKRMSEMQAVEPAGRSSKRQRSRGTPPAAPEVIDLDNYYPSVSVNNSSTPQQQTGMERNTLLSSPSIPREAAVTSKPHHTD